MSSELIIKADKSGVNLALLKDKKLIELHQERSNEQFAVGDMYLGQVRKIMPGLNAAFVNVGYEKDAFLHYLDLGPQVRSLIKYVKLARNGTTPGNDLAGFETEPDIIKTGKITEVLKKGTELVVQVVKEPISTKGPRITSELSLPGRYVVLVPFSNQISISKKIKSFEERTRLKNLGMTIKPQGFGLIVRTVAEGCSAAELHKDLLDLHEKWQKLNANLQGKKAPVRVLSEISRVSGLLRDILNDGFSNIITDSRTLYNEIRTYIRQISPEKERIVSLYEGKAPIFEQYGVEKQIRLYFGKTVSMHGGAYLVIEHTEALHVIDVNSGSKTPDAEANQEQNALKVNLEAAEEIARQLRLRDMGGIVVIDFIDMKSAGNRKLVYEKLREEMKNDRARHTILPMSKFGLVEITRQRVRPEITVDITEQCPMCNGTGKAGPSMVISDEIEQKIGYLVQNLNLKDLVIITHPYIAAYLNKGFPSLRRKWAWKYKTGLKVKEDAAMHMGQYQFSNKIGEEIML